MAYRNVDIQGRQGMNVRKGLSGAVLIICLTCFQAEAVKSFTANVGGTVTDIGTGLTWQQGEEGGTKRWEDALIYCENLILAGTSDWHLPNMKELSSLVDDSRVNPALDQAFFPGVHSSSWYWSSTTSSAVSTAAWYVYFGQGFVGGTNKANVGYVRCVRGGQ